MFWADSVIAEIKSKYKDKIESEKDVVIRDEKTASGPVHVGSLRGVIIHGAISKLLSKEKIDNTFFYEINDFDPMDGLPQELKERFSEHMGKPLCNVPSPDEKSKSFAEYYGDEFKEVINKLGFNPEFYKVSDLYKEGKFNETIRIALDNAEKIREIYKKISGSEKDADWFPLNVVCRNCGKLGSTKVNGWDGEDVSYKCGDFVEWAKGCGHEGKMSPFDGNASLPWKVEWAAKFKVLDVNVEGAGKDHSTAGGARQVSNTICREIFNHQPPYDVPYEFLLIDGKKMSSSKGFGATSKEMSELLPPEILNLLLLYKKPNQTLEFDPTGDTIPNLYDTYDRFAEDYFNGKEDYTSVVFELIHPDKKGLEKRFLPRFSQIVYLSQMPHLDIVEEIEKNENIKLSKRDKEEVEHRIKYSKIWLEKFAPDKFKFEIQQEIPTETENFSKEQKEALGKVVIFLKENKEMAGKELHEALHQIKKDVSIEPKDFFEAIYISILGKNSGPKAGWFLGVLDRYFVISRFEEIIK